MKKPKEKTREQERISMKKKQKNSNAEERETKTFFPSFLKHIILTEKLSGGNCRRVFVPLGGLQSSNDVDTRKKGRKEKRKETITLF